MTKQEYLGIIKYEKGVQKDSNERLDVARKDYIRSNSPCNLNDKVLITLKSGRVVKGEVNSFHILQDKNVYIASYKDLEDRGKIKYITVPTKSVQLLYPHTINNESNYLNI